MEKDESIFEGTFYFDPEDRIYEVHFPSNPVVPGSVIVHAFMEAAGKAGFSDGFSKLKNFGFKGFVAPGEYGFLIKEAGDGLHCELYHGKKTVVTGKLVKCD